MKLYYYEYETTVFRPFFDTEYDLKQGYLVESPLGVIQYFGESDTNEFGSIDEFTSYVDRFLPRNLQIVELK